MFTSVSTRATTAYQKVGAESRVMGASPHGLVQVLFDEFLAALRIAGDAIKNQDKVTKAKKIALAVRIMDGGLRSNLDLERGGELAQNLMNLYDYCLQRLTLANLRGDEAALQEVTRLIEPLAQSWKEIEGEAHA